MRVIQLDIEPEAMHQNKPAEVALVGDGKAIVGQLNQALTNRQWFYPKETPWHAAIAKKSAENAALIAPQIADDRRRPITTGACGTLPPGCRKTRSSAPRAPARWISAAPSCRTSTRARGWTPAAMGRWVSAWVRHRRLRRASRQGGRACVG